VIVFYLFFYKCCDQILLLLFENLNRFVFMVLVFGFSVPLENQQSVNKISHKTPCFHCGTNY